MARNQVRSGTLVEAGTRAYFSLQNVSPFPLELQVNLITDGGNVVTRYIPLERSPSPRSARTGRVRSGASKPRVARTGAASDAGRAHASRVRRTPTAAVWWPRRLADG